MSGGMDRDPMENSGSKDISKDKEAKIIELCVQIRSADNEASRLLEHVKSLRKELSRLL